VNLFERLCDIKPKNRYQCSRALRHPWITKDENGVVPLNFFDELVKNNELYEKFKLVQAKVFAIVALRGKVLKKDRSEILNDYKHQIIEEEYLEFTPTPKATNLGFGKYGSENQNKSSSNSDEGSEFTDFLKPKFRVKKGTKSIRRSSKLSEHKDFMIRSKVKSQNSKNTSKRRFSANMRPKSSKNKKRSNSKFTKKINNGKISRDSQANTFSRTGSMFKKKPVTLKNDK